MIHLQTNLMIWISFIYIKLEKCSAAVYMKVFREFNLQQAVFVRKLHSQRYLVLFVNSLQRLISMLRKRSLPERNPEVKGQKYLLRPLYNLDIFVNKVASDSEAVSLILYSLLTTAFSIALPGPVSVIPNSKRYAVD